MIKLIVGLALGGAVATSAMLLPGGDDLDRVTFERIHRGTLRRHVMLQGPVLPAQYATIAPRMPSRVAHLYVREGEEVKRGDRVILLDASELAVDVERKRLAAERARLQRQDREFRSAKTGEPRYASGGLEDLEVKLADLELARARSILRDSILVAPFDGIVVQVGAREGEMLSPLRATNGEGVIIAGTREFVIKGELDEYEAGEVKLGAKAAIEFEAVRGAVTAGTVTATPSLRRFRPDARQAATFEVTVALMSVLPPGVTVGHTGTVRIQAATDTEYLLVPVSGVLHVDGADYVIERVGRRNFSPRKVTLGSDDNRNVTVLEGIGENAEVATGDLTVFRRRFWPTR